jgi:glucokinase
MVVQLVGDIGATNARFGLLENGNPQSIEVLSVAAYPTLDAAIRAYLTTAAPDKPPREGALAVAGPVTGDYLAFTNHPWSFSIKELTRELGFDRLEIVNDFVAAALAIPRLGPDDRRQIGPGTPVADTPVGIIGPGTGLGVSSLIPTPDGRKTWMALPGEGGHVTLSTVEPREMAIVEWLHRSGRAHVSAERLISGAGLETLYSAVTALDGAVRPPSSAAEITARAKAVEDPHAVEAVHIFCALLGTVAGNLALTIGARGGVYIAGGIVPKLGDIFDKSEFRARFVAKGRMQTYLEPIPTYVMTHPFPAFLGLAGLLSG